MIDNAGSNLSRHLFILTTNTLDVNPNLIGRTGRIRYLVNYHNLPESTVNEYIDDNLKPELAHLKDGILEKVNLLEYNSIDLLKSIVEEVNITGTVDSPENEIMNIPVCKYSWDVYEFENAEWNDIEKIKKFVAENNPNKLSFVEWLAAETEIGEDKKVNNESLLDDEFSYLCMYKKRITSQFSHIWKDCELSSGTALMEPDSDGFFSYICNYDRDEKICIILRQKTNAGLYNRSIL
jgi:hypothetical protein